MDSQGLDRLVKTVKSLHLYCPYIFKSQSLDGSHSSFGIIIHLGGSFVLHWFLLSLKGPRGLNGDPGSPGPIGISLDGPQGPSGLPGPPGRRGAPGDAFSVRPGVPGQPGLQGAVGPKGFRGISGSPGAPGKFHVHFGKQK